MTKKIIVVSVLFILPAFVYAYTLLLNVFDNKDNTITAEGAFTTGQKAIGALIKLESIISGEVLYKKRLPDESELTIPILFLYEEYQIVLDGGPGHIIVKKGLAPLEGFKIKASEGVINRLSFLNQNNKDLEKPLVILFSLAVILLLLILYFSSWNTKKLIKRLEENQYILFNQLNYK